jgi:Xaa-Pro aminopeptidase
MHDKGDVSSINHAEVKEGMIFSIEPGIYLPSKVGVRYRRFSSCNKRRRISTKFSN